MKFKFRLLGLFSVFCLIFSSLFVVSVAAGAQIDETSVTPARTINNFQTGVLTYQEVSIDKYQEHVLLTGTVDIDGPQLVLAVNGVDVSASANIIKLGDNLWSFAYDYAFNGAVGDISINLQAYTIYKNGKTAGKVHTNAAPVTQTVHVPYVTSFDITDLVWTGYDPDSNTITYTYKLLKIWDDATITTDEADYSGSVLGTESLLIYASDVTHQNGNIVLVTSIVPPVYFRSFSILTNPSDYNWVYDENSGTYQVTFEIEKSYSDGSTLNESYTLYGLTPGENNLVSLEVNGVIKSFNFLAPASPIVVTAPIVLSVDVIIISTDRLAANADQNNVKVQYALLVNLSDGTSFTADGFTVTVPLNGGNASGSKDVTKTLTYGDYSFDLSFTVLVE